MPDFHGGGGGGGAAIEAEYPHLFAMQDGGGVGGVLPGWASGLNWNGNIPGTAAAEWWLHRGRIERPARLHGILLHVVQGAVGATCWSAVWRANSDWTTGALVAAVPTAHAAAAVGPAYKALAAPVDITTPLDVICGVQCSTDMGGANVRLGGYYGHCGEASVSRLTSASVVSAMRVAGVLGTIPDPGPGPYVLNTSTAEWGCVFLVLTPL